MTAVELAKKLNNRQYLSEITPEEEAIAAENGLVVVFGFSDDNIEFRGAIDAELDAWEGGNFYVCLDGDLSRHIKTYKDKNSVVCKKIKAMWHDGWSYSTEIPHATFNIYTSDKDLACVGIVFSMKDVLLKKSKPLVINLFGAPGTGKSTGAAYIFSKLKMAGVNAELVTEFAKDKVWEESHAPFENQLYMLAKQYFRITRCESKVDVIVTDSPILLSLIYCADADRLGKAFPELVKHLHDYYRNYNVFLKRVKEYNPVGRFQTESESNELAGDIENMLLVNKIPYSVFNGDISGYDKIVENILSMLKE